MLKPINFTQFKSELPHFNRDCVKIEETGNFLGKKYIFGDASVKNYPDILKTINYVPLTS